MKSEFFLQKYKTFSIIFLFFLKSHFLDYNEASIRSKSLVRTIGF